jgi:hypothetical protein
MLTERRRLRQRSRMKGIALRASAQSGTRIDSLLASAFPLRSRRATIG